MLQQSLLFLLPVVIGCVIIATSIPLARRKIGRNPWYGFRTKRTLSSDEIWYSVNENVAKKSIYIGIVNIVFGLGAIALSLPPYRTLFFITLGLPLVSALSMCLITSLEERKVS
jgi:hypothetical protein